MMMYGPHLPVCERISNFAPAPEYSQINRGSPANARFACCPTSVAREVNAALADAVSNKPVNNVSVFKGATPALRQVRDIVRILTPSASQRMSHLGAWAPCPASLF